MKVSAAERQFCHCCDCPLENDRGGTGLLLWLRGDRVEYEEPPLCFDCSQALQLTPSEGPSSAPTPEEELEGENRTVMVVESQTDMQNTLREKLKQRGYRVLITSSPPRALQRFADSAEDERPADCIVFSTIQLGSDALQAFNAMGDDPHTRQVPAILFADRRQQSLLQQAKLGDSRMLLKSPLKMRELRLALLRLLKSN